MYIKKLWIALSILLIPCIGNAQEIKIDESWLHQSLNVIGRTDSRFGPRLTNDLYPEYTVAGRKDWFDFYGYVAVSYTHLTLPTTRLRCRSRWSPYH